MLTFVYKLKSFLLYAALFLGIAGNCQAESFTGHGFLKLQSMNQKFWINGSIDTMIHIASSREKKQGECIAKWYYGDKKAERNSLILAAMKQYGDMKPSTIMIALLENACGKFRKG